VTDELLKLYMELFYLAFYPVLIVVLVLYLNLGIFSWLFIGLFLTLPTAAWYIILKRRALNYLRMLLDSNPRPWNIEETVNEFIELLKNQRRKRKT